MGAKTMNRSFNRRLNRVAAQLDRIDALKALAAADAKTIEADNGPGPAEGWIRFIGPFGVEMDIPDNGRSLEPWPPDRIVRIGTYDADSGDGPDDPFECDGAGVT
jgi:hypothetical protein